MPTKPLGRREFLLGAGATALALTAGGARSRVQAQTVPGDADMTVHIAPVTLELAPGRII
jgi:hypothetical protein